MGADVPKPATNSRFVCCRLSLGCPSGNFITPSPKRPRREALHSQLPRLDQLRLTQSMNCRVHTAGPFEWQAQSSHKKRWCLEKTLLAFAILVTFCASESEATKLRQNEVRGMLFLGFCFSLNAWHNRPRFSKMYISATCQACQLVRSADGDVFVQRTKVLFLASTNQSRSGQDRLPGRGPSADRASAGPSSQRASPLATAASFNLSLAACRRLAGLGQGHALS